MAFESNIKSIVHFMVFPGPRLEKNSMRGEAPEKYMIDSFETIRKSNYFNGIEVTHVKNPILRKKLALLYKKAKYFVTFCAQPIQLLNEDNLIERTDISSINEIERINAVIRLKTLIDEAYEIEAQNFCFLSGEDPKFENQVSGRRLALRSLTISIKEICKYNREVALKLNKPPLKITLELFDRIPHPTTKNQLLGPSSEARALAEEVKDELGYLEFGLLYDISHMFLIYDGDQRENVDVIRSLKSYLNWVHIANVINDESHLLFGDNHLSMDYPEGAVTPQIMTEFYTALMDIDFQGGIGLEVMPRGEQLSESVMYSGISSMKNSEAQIQVNYALGTYRFNARQFLPERLFYQITEYKINHSDQIKIHAKNRLKREYPWKSNLFIIAADHPARNVTNVGDNVIAMGDRHQYLARIVRTLIDKKIDGIMATPDIFDDLFTLDHMIKEAGGESILDNRILIGCTNRSGLSGSMFEMDDRITAYTVDEIIEMNMDGLKMMFRLDLETSQARYSQQTIVTCADVIRECGKFNLPVFLEPLPVEKIDNQYQIKRNHVDLIKTIGIATAIGGASSSQIWLKIPYVDHFDQVSRSTSNPILLLGGASTGKPTDMLINFEKGLAAGPNIKGALVGRNLLFPGFDDPLAVSLAISRIVHDNGTSEEAVKLLRIQRGKAMDYLTKLLLKEK